YVTYPEPISENNKKRCIYGHNIFKPFSSGKIIDTVNCIIDKMRINLTDQKTESLLLFKYFFFLDYLHTLSQIVDHFIIRALKLTDFIIPCALYLAVKIPRRCFQHMY